MRQRNRILLGAIILIILTSYLTFTYTMLRFQNLYSVTREELNDMEDFFTVLNALQKDFVNDIPVSQIIEGAVSGMLEAADDPYTTYLDTKQYQRLLQQTGGSFGGIGLYVGVRDGKIVIIAPIEGTPAATAGLIRGDEIVGVDGTDVRGQALDDVVDMMRGIPGTSVIVSVQRNGEESPRDFQIVRAVISIETVKSNMLESKIGYIAISEFNRNTSQDFAIALAKLKAEGMIGLVLDLRDNPGGLLTESVHVAEYLVDEGVIVHIVSRDGIQETMKSKTKGLGLPLVVLINDGSASASEIIAGAVKDRQAGSLVGVKTFGKASVQGIFSLRNGGGYKITTEKYLTPNETLIHGYGIDPDVEVYGLGDRAVSRGIVGDDVTDLAHVMIDLGYFTGVPQDVFGEEIESAIRLYQKAKRIEETGIASRNIIYDLLEEWTVKFPDAKIRDTQLMKAMDEVLRLNQ